MSPSGAAAGVQYDDVLVPLDGSELAVDALATARALAAGFGAQLRTISVATDSADVTRLRESATVALETVAGDPHVAVVSAPDAAEEIVRHATELGRTLVCMSTHGRGRLIGALLGSVAREVVQLSGQPLVVLGPQAERSGWSSARSWPPPLSVRRIVACVDGSTESEAVLPVAIEWARTLDMALTILTVVEPDADTTGYIDQLVDQHQVAGLTLDGAVIPDPISPASGLRTYLDREPTGLVALTTHARSGLQRVRLGSAAADIVHASPAPCLVVPPPTVPRAP